MEPIQLQVQGGFCNRLRAIISASLWAEDLGCDLWIYWPIQPGHMPCSLEEILIPASISRCKKVVDNELSGAVEVQKYESARAEFAKGAEKRQIASYSIFHPDFHGPRGRCLLRCLRLRSEVEAAAEGIWKCIGGASNWIGIHIRQTDHVKCIADSPLDAFEKVIQQNEGKKFLLVSDDQTVLERFSSPDKVYSHRFPLGRLDKIQQIHGVIDWILLQKVSLIIGSAGSSFSELAAWRSGAELKNP
jgi:hypothetical protein